MTFSTLCPFALRVEKKWVSKKIKMKNVNNSTTDENGIEKNKPGFFDKKISNEYKRIAKTQQLEMNSSQVKNPKNLHHKR